MSVACVQELVNLLLTGEAVSNVFNDVMELDSGTGDCMVLRGISARSDIGPVSYTHLTLPTNHRV